MLQNILEDRSLKSGFNTSKNAYVKHQLLKTQRNNNASGPANFPSMTIDRDRAHGNSSELNQSTASKPEAEHVPQLLLTQTMQFHQKRDKSRNALASLDTGNLQQSTVADSVMLTPHDFAVSQENPLMAQTFKSKAPAAIDYLDSPSVTRELSLTGSPTKAVNPLRLTGLELRAEEVDVVSPVHEAAEEEFLSGGRPD